MIPATPRPMRPTPLPVLVAGIPTRLQHEPRWVVWSYECRHGRWTKVLHRASSPNICASSTDPATWDSFWNALAVYRAGVCDGIGFVLGDGYVGFDADHCVHEGKVDPDALALLDLLSTYTELSVSGAGVHAIARGVKPGSRCRTRSFELYATGRFFTVTGHRLPNAPATVEERTPELSALYAALFGADERQSIAIEAPPAFLDPNDCRGTEHLPDVAHLSDDELLTLAREAANGEKFAALWRGDCSGYPSHSEADMALCCLLCFWTQGNTARMDRLFRRSGLMRPKWDTRRGETTYGGLVLSRARERTTEIYMPVEHSLPLLRALPEPRAPRGLRTPRALRSLRGL